ATSAAAHLQWHKAEPNAELIVRDDIPPPPDGYGTVGPYYAKGAIITDFKPAPTKRVYMWDVYTLCAAKVGGHSMFTERTLSRRPWQEEFPGVEDPVFLCSLCTVFNAYVKEGGLPPRSAKYPPRESESHWLSMGWFNVVYPRGRPHELFWNENN
ncbi:MAG: hypothetical protein JWM11_3633, partial [Planctomycetaceae bacterium]|nr:hypothetical protein [Planctomycetaceae bacterium]